MSDDDRYHVLPLEDQAVVNEYQNRGSNVLSVVKVLAILALVFGGCAALLSGLEWTKGRPLRGRRRRPRRKDPASASALGRAAAGWRAIAADEYESIASFAELALDLMAAGAPVDLVRRCHAAALEEERHTATCLEIAESLDGQPSPTPEVRALAKTRRRPRWRTALLSRLAVESYLDGCIGEASSAWTLARLGRIAESPRIRAALRTLAREEMGHARLGRDIVAWCCREGGAVVQRAVEVAQSRVATLNSPTRSDVADPELRVFGVPDDDLRTQAFIWARHREHAAVTTTHC